jgi:transcriptional regulator of heat shock response
MDTRKERLLKCIVENYIETAEPIGSQFLLEKTDFDLSAATLRNEMRELEEEGYLTHPHTSAGRIPTEAGYRYYIETFLHTPRTKKSEMARLKGASRREGLKGMGRAAADMTENAVIIALNPDSVYYTGISRLFTQPEFHDYAHTVEMSELFERFEARMDDLFAMAAKGDIRALVGDANPLGSACGAVVARLGNDALIVMVGPMRMDYEQGMRIARTIQELI